MVIPICFEPTPVTTLTKAQTIEQNEIEENAELTCSPNRGAFVELLEGLLAKSESEKNEIVHFSVNEVSEIDFDKVCFANQFAGYQLAETTMHDSLEIGESIFAEHSLLEHVITSPDINQKDTQTNFEDTRLDMAVELLNSQFESQKLSNVKPEAANSKQPVAEETISLVRAVNADDESNPADRITDRIKGKDLSNERVSRGFEQINVNQETNQENSRRSGSEENFSRQDQSNFNRPDEVRGRNRHDRISGNRIAFEVHDHRTAAGVEKAGTEMKLASVMETSRVQQTPVQEITLELKLTEGQSTAQTNWEAKTTNTASNFLENMLARELHQNFNGDIVRHASMALRDGGEGIIKLALKPESLGNVKIHLKMSDNKITGYIVVESEEALNAFRKEIASLEKAFREFGFFDANLDLSMASDDSNKQWNEQDVSSFLPRMVASNYDDLIPSIDVLFEQRSNVNMLA